MAVRRETPVDQARGRQARSEEVWVWLQRDREGRLEPAGFELLYESQGLARRLDAQLTAVSDVSPGAEEADLLRRWGVRRVRTLGTELPPHPLCTKGDSPLRPLLDAVRSQGVTIRAALLPATTFGKVAAPLFAAELDASFVPGVTSVTSDGRHYVLARPVYGEQYEALVSLELGRPLVATVLPGAVGEGVRPPAAAAPRGGLQVAEPRQTSLRRRRRPACCRPTRSAWTLAMRNASSRSAGGPSPLRPWRWWSGWPRRWGRRWPARGPPPTRAGCPLRARWG